LKRLLIISPYFPPTNAADMQRIRMSLPYFKQFGYEATVVTINPLYSDLPQDELLSQTVPADVHVYYVKAFNKKLTSKLGLGSIALRSLYHYRKKVNSLLQQKKYALIYFSTTQFPVCILGPYWKKKFHIPYVIDMQDPWHSDYYLNKPKAQRPPKYWLSYRLNKYLEPLAIKNADGLISVSPAYIEQLKERYPQIKNIPAATITFGAFEPDLKIAAENKFTDLLTPGFKNLVCIGRGGMDMHAAITPLFQAIKAGLISHPELFKKLKVYFIGTSYAAAGKEVNTISPLAAQFGLGDQVIEITSRISYYHTIATLNKADALFIPGSDDPKYTASKIYPYLLTQKPMLAVINSHSPANGVLGEYGAPYVYNYNHNDDITNQVAAFLTTMLNGKIPATVYNNNALNKYSAQNLTSEQCMLFNQVISGKIQTDI